MMYNEFKTTFPHITKTHEWGLITKLNDLQADTQDIINTSASALPKDERGHFTVTLLKHITRRRFPDQSKSAITDIVKLILDQHPTQ